MCIFTGGATALESVAGTSIFARSLDGGRQILVYGMTVAASEPVAMVLPLPVPPGTAEDAVRFIDLQGYPRFFDDLKAAFPRIEYLSLGVQSQSLGRGPVPKTLVVHEVGAFVASFVPSRADFERLDPRFRLADAVWDALPAYADWGFAVFQLRGVGERGWMSRLLRRAATGPQEIHPMAFELPRRDPGRVFFPTVHVHDGQVYDQAAFDHALYVQLRPGEMPGESGWKASSGPLSRHVDEHRAAGVIVAGLPGWKVEIEGLGPNVDTWLEPQAQDPEDELPSLVD